MIALYQTYIKEGTNNLRAVFFTSCCVATCTKCNKKTIVLQNVISNGKYSQWTPVTACCKTEKYIIEQQITPLEYIDIVNINSYTLEEAQLTHHPEKFINHMKEIMEEKEKNRKNGDFNE